MPTIKKTKNKHAVALGKLGGAGGAGKEKRRISAVEANRIRWENHRLKNSRK